MKNKLSLILTFAVIIAIGFGIFLKSKTDYSNITRQCNKKIENLLKANGIDTQSPLKESSAEDTGFRKKALTLEKEFIVPYLASLDYLRNSLIHDLDFSPASISEIKKTQKENQTSLTLEISFKELVLYKLTLWQKEHKGKIALVIDDWGYSSRVLDKALEIDAPMTYAVLPNIAFSKKVVDNAHQKGAEIILHLPLEPHNSDKISLEKNTIMTNMDPDAVDRILDEQISSIPYLTGINNHMGSKATEDFALMSRIFESAKKRDLYFLDSYTSGESVLEDVAKNENITFLKRDIFLDNKSDKEIITAQLLKARDIAEKTGSVIAIGHAKYLTLEVLAEYIPKLQAQGFRFVYLSDLIKTTEK